MNNSIRQNEWRDFLRDFWDGHRSAKATIEVEKDAVGCHLAKMGRQLRGIRIERSGNDIVLRITLSDINGAHQVRTIINPVSIAYLPDREYLRESVRIEESDGTKTLLTVDDPKNGIDDYLLDESRSSFQGVCRQLQPHG